MDVGFTGTQDGMTDDQKYVVKQLLWYLKPSIVHHGDCIGADAEFHGICRRLPWDVRIVGHPGMDRRGRSLKRAYCDVDGCNPTLPYLDRNRMIIYHSNILIATPKGFEEELRSGTWMTIRLAKAKAMFRDVVFPDGTVEHGFAEQPTKTTDWKGKKFNES